MQEPLGLIGLGLVGKALASRLIAVSHRVLGYDIAGSARLAAAGLGVEVCRDACEVASRCSIILLSLPDSDIVSRLLWSDGLADALRPGALVLDTTTGRPSDARETAGRLAERGVRFVDVTLSGSSEEIARGEATALVGDADPRRTGVSPVSRRTGVSPVNYDAVLRTFARTVFYLGAPGNGCLAKLVTNHVMGLNRAALAEGLALGLKAGLDGATLLDMLRESAAYSRVLDLKGRRMVEGDFAPASRIAQHEKDVRLILELAQEVGAWAPLEEAHERLLEEALARGLGELDNAALIRVFTEDRG